MTETKTKSIETEETALKKTAIITKNILIALGVVLGISVLINVFQLTGGFTKSKKIKKLSTSLAQIEEQAGSLASSNSELELDLSNLQTENVTLLDSVTYLNRTIHRLRSKIRSKDKRLSEMNESLALLRAKEAELNKQVVSFSADIDDSQIVGLQQKQQELQQKISLLKNRSDSLATVKEVLYQRMLRTEQEKQDYIKRDMYHQEILDIIENAKVEFYEISPRRSNGKTAKSIKKWFDTKINFAIDYDDIAKLEGQEFMVKVIDNNTGETITPQESDDNVSGGISFIFAGNPAPEMTYTHIEKKSKGSFTVQVYFKQQSKEYLLSNGVSAIQF
jgi:DNA repair exonuclease SbcCD ATPase subunit